MAITTTEFKDKFRAMLGYAEDSTGAVKDRVNRLFQRTHFYNLAQRSKANAGEFANTGSVSVTEPIREQVCYVVEEACVVQSIAYVVPPTGGRLSTPTTSISVSLTDTWSIVIRKFNAATVSQSTHVASLTCNTDTITQKKPRGVNPCTLTSTVASKTLAANDVLTVQVQKNGAGAFFRGGLFKITVDEA